jgi:uncharacterized protein (TIGR03437 family)
MQKYLLAIVLLSSTQLWGQAPVITGAVTTAALDTNFGPGSTLYIYGTFAEFAAGRDFTISVGGVSGGIEVADNTLFITAQIPVTAPAGPQNLVVTYQGQASNPLPITMNALAPEFGGVGVTITGPFNPPVYGPYYPFGDANSNTRITPTNPASRGEPLSAAVFGIGTEPPASATITVGGQPAQIAQLTSLTGSATYYFFVPDNAPLGIDPVVLTIGGVSTEPASIPVGTTPVIGAILNGASFGSTSVAAPGAIVSLFGASFGTADNLLAFPSTSVNSTSVMFGTTAAPIFALAAKEGQINVQVPAELPPSGTVNVTVQTASGTSAAYTLNLAPAAPGIFYLTDPALPTRRNAVAVIANTSWFAMPASMATHLGLPTTCTVGATCGQPAHPGDFLQIYVTGLGAVSPPLATGTVAPAGGDPLHLTVATPSVSIGGVQAPVLFSGVAPGFAGLYQVDVQIPASVAAGSDVPLQIFMPGSAVDTATIAVSTP